MITGTASMELSRRERRYRESKVRQRLHLLASTVPVSSDMIHVRKRPIRAACVIGERSERRLLYTVWPAKGERCSETRHGVLYGT
jgi:hypothetical protein